MAIRRELSRAFRGLRERQRRTWTGPERIWVELREIQNGDADGLVADITRRVEMPLVTYCGDTGPGSFLALDHVRTSRILLLECTFVDDEHRERARAGSLCRRLNVRFAGLDQRARELSGGNQQKLAVARLLLRDSPILLLDEPTRGIDVASKVEIYRRIGAWAAEGRTIVMTSSHLPELLGICDSIAVMHRGRLSPVRPAAAWSEQAIMEWAVAGRDKDGG